MNAKILGMLVALTVVAVGGVFVLGRQDQAPTPNPAPTVRPTATASASVSPQLGPVVRYDGTTFSPAEVRIKLGQTVTFINDSSSELVVASDPHPVHTNLRGFASEENVAQGKTYSFTFTKAGNWGYHNHNKASVKGRVIVE